MSLAWLTALFAAAVLLPSANHQWFSGLPLNTRPECLFLLIAAPILAHRGARRLAGRRLARYKRVGPLLGGAAAVAILLKVLLLTSGDYRGVLGCYSSPLSAPPAGHCETSYENPFRRFGVTRIDDRIDFAPDTWNLSFLNSTRFNIYPWVAGNRRRDRLPLDVQWSSWLHTDEPRVATITYTGEGAVVVGERSVQLEPSYAERRTTTLAVPAGTRRLFVRYRFEDHTYTFQPNPGPYATLHITYEDAAGEPAAVTLGPERPRAALRLAARATDLLLGLTLAVLAWFVVTLCWRDAGWVLLIGAAGWATPSFIEQAGLPFDTLKSLVVASLVLLFVLARPQARRSITAFLMLAGLSVVTIRPLLPTSDIVTMRWAGDDWLTYESMPRAILDSGSLAGGENVFYYQPFGRYARFLEHLVAGDGDAIVLAAEFALLTFGIIWMVRRFYRRGARPSRVVSIAAGILMLGVACSTVGAFGFLRAGASESWTWIMLPAFMPLLFASRTTGAHVGGTMMLGLSALTRLNQLPALLVTFGAFLLREARVRRRGAIGLCVLLTAILLLPLVHNLVYGGRAVLFTTSAGIPQNYVITPRTLLATWSDPAARATVLLQLRTMFALLAPSPDWVILGRALHGLQLLWIGVTVWGLASGRLTRSLLLLAATPVVYLGVHLFYQVNVYYPRHILAAHLMMGVVAVILARSLTAGLNAAGPAVVD